MTSPNECSDRELVHQFVNCLVGLPLDTPEPTDAEVSKSIKNEWLKVLRRLWLAYDKPIQPEQFELFVEELGDIPIGLLESAIKALINDGNRAPFFPRLSELKAAISHEIKKDCTDGSLSFENIDEWCRRQEQKFIARCTWSNQ